MSDVIERAPQHTYTRSVQEEMETSYLSYAMSVIVSRALPDVRDGLKPVHRRILYVTSQDYKASGHYKKSARIVGDVMGKFHPHGDSAIYEAMVRLAQPFSLATPLIDGQGNFGSIDGDSPAAMRYTEAKMAPVAHALTDDLELLDPRRADMKPNYDETELEPRVMPARFPNLLVNGGEGIAVGMASSIAPHNLGEVIDATVHLLDNPDATLSELMRIMPGPDFPTGGIIRGTAGIRQAYETGKGSIPMSSVHTIEVSKSGKQSIIITELPYQVNKKTLLESIGELVKSGAIVGITAVRDESTKTIRVVIDIKRDGDATLVLNQLKRMTALSSNFSFNGVALDAKGQPRLMGVLDMLREYIDFRRGVIYDRTEYQLNKSRDQLAQLLGLYVARSNLDTVVSIIRSSTDRDEARARLMALSFDVDADLSALLKDVEPDQDVPAAYRMSAPQAEAVLRQRLSALTSMEREKIATDVRAVVADIRVLAVILSEPDELDTVFRDEMEGIRRLYAKPRRTVIEPVAEGDVSEDDLVEDKALVLTLTRTGYIKTTPLDVYREQSRGGKGRAGMDTKENDDVIKTLVCRSRDRLVLFTTRGIAHQLKAWKLPELAPSARGKPIVNYIDMRSGEGETVTTIIVEPASADDSRSLVFVTSAGDVRRNAASAFSSVNKGGKIAMKLVDDDGRSVGSLVDVVACTEDDDILLYTSGGKAARLPVKEMRVMQSRNSIGVIGIKLLGDAKVLGAVVLKHVEMSQLERQAYARKDGVVEATDEEGNTTTFTLPEDRRQVLQETEQFIMTMTAMGYGKRFSGHEIRPVGRGSQGVEIGNFGRSSGPLVACAAVEDEDGVTLVSKDGQFIRTRAADIRMTNRTARGVIVFDLLEDQTVVDVSTVPAEL